MSAILIPIAVEAGAALLKKLAPPLIHGVEDLFPPKSGPFKLKAVSTALTALLSIFGEAVTPGTAATPAAPATPAAAPLDVVAGVQKIVDEMKASGELGPHTAAAPPAPHAAAAPSPHTAVAAPLPPAQPPSLAETLAAAAGIELMLQGLLKIAASLPGLR